jgi:peptide deformylase
VVLPIIKFGHPVLREKGKGIERITEEVRRLAADMVETMYAANGVGLAAQQIGRALMLTVIDATESEQPSEYLVDGKPQELPPLMPLVLLNPAIVRSSGEQIGIEGCLSVPEISADIRRAARVAVEAVNLDGDAFAFECIGLLARAVQHEVDHLNGILFIDRMDAAMRASLAGKLKRLEKTTADELKESRRARRSTADRF